jgi:methylase of polypeptide subunit release factors
MSESKQEQELSPQRLMQMSWGYAPPLIIETALHFKLFDLIEEGANTVGELAKRSGGSERGLRAVLNALVALEFLSKDAQERYSLTPESATFLVTRKPSFHGAFFKHISAQLIPKWLQIHEIVRSGRPSTAVNQEGEGGAFFEEFVEALFPMAYMASQALGRELHVSETKERFNILDLAAGSGVWGIGVAQQSANAQVTAVDWPAVIPVTRRVAARFGLEDRFKFVPGDLRDADFGSAHHLATLGHILHSEGAERSRTLLHKVFGALAPGGTIAIAEFLSNKEHSGPPVAAIFAVNMLVNTEHGDTFSFEEISEWLKEAGFVEPRLLDVPAVSPLVLATKPK